MNQSREAKNKAVVLEAFEALFNKRDYTAAEGFWSPDYIQHSAHIGPGRDGLFDLIKSIPPTLKYEPGMIVADGDIVIVHGRFSGFGAPVNWIAADILRVEGGGFSSSTGTSSKTKPPASNRGAAYRCSGTHSPVRRQRCDTEERSEPCP